MMSYEQDQRLLARLVRAWCKETSVNEQWTPDNPALGQCAVTALVIQDYFGGNLARVINEDVSHYFNVLHDGSWLDLTRSQFDTWEPYGLEIRTRDYVLSFKPTEERYNLLLSKMGF